MLSKDLQQLGFTKNLSTVYLVLFELGEAKAGEIVRRTGMHRNIVYRALEELEEKKLLTKSQVRGVARYKALDPTRLMGEVESKQKLAEQIIEELKTKHKVVSQEIVVYEGKEETRKKFLELYSILQSGDTWDIIGLSPDVFPLMGDATFDEMVRLHNERKFHIRGISGYVDPLEGEYAAKTNGLTEFQLIPSISKKDTEITILKDRVIIFMFSEPHTVVEIFNEGLVSGYKEYFELLWNQEVVTYVGWDAIEQYFFQEMLPQLGKGHVEMVFGGGYQRGIVDEKRFKDFFLRYNSIGVKKGFEKHIIGYEKYREELELEMSQSGDDGSYAHIRYIPPQYEAPIEVHVFPTSVVLISWSQEPVATVYQDKNVIDGYKKQFQFLWNQEVQTYSGWGEIETLFFEYILPSQLKGDVEYNLGAGYGESGSDERVIDFYLRYNTERTKKGITKKIIFSEQHREESFQEFTDAGDEKFEFVDVRYVPDQYYSAMQTHITKDKVIIIMWSENPVATVYEDPNIVASFKKQFDQQWDTAKK